MVIGDSRTINWKPILDQNLHLETAIRKKVVYKRFNSAIFGEVLQVVLALEWWLKMYGSYFRVYILGVGRKSLLRLITHNNTTKIRNVH